MIQNLSIPHHKAINVGDHIANVLNYVCIKKKNYERFYKITFINDIKIKLKEDVIIRGKILSKKK